MKLATWNVNSIGARLERLLAWLDERRPDVVCLQETKTVDDKFPFEALRERGYSAVVTGQKSYNGVALLARAPLELTDVVRGLGDGHADDASRFIAATVGGVRVLSVYAPNGQSVGSDKWAYKLEWNKRLRRWLDAHAAVGQPLALCGDLNVAPEARDTNDPAFWATTTMFHPAAVEGFTDLVGWGLVDTFRLRTPDAGLFSWWDYRAGNFHKGIGVRIDHVLATPVLAARCVNVAVDREARKGKEPSDHAPVMALFDEP